jgi:hypothetical protein
MGIFAPALTASLLDSTRHTKKRPSEELCGPSSPQSFELTPDSTRHTKKRPLRSSVGPPLLRVLSFTSRLNEAHKKEAL